MPAWIDQPIVPGARQVIVAGASIRGRSSVWPDKSDWNRRSAGAGADRRFGFLWDREFVSHLLQRGVCELSVSCGASNFRFESPATRRPLAWSRTAGERHAAEVDTSRPSGPN